MYKDNQFNRKINRVGVPYGYTCPKWEEPEQIVRKIKVKRKKKEPEPEPVVRKIKVKRKKKEKVLPAQPIMTPLVAEPAPRMGILDAPREVFDVPDRLAPLPPPLQQPRKSLMEQELEMGMGMGMGGGTFMVNTITGDIIEVPIIDGISPVEMVRRVDPELTNIQLLDDDGNEVEAVVDGMMVNMMVDDEASKSFKKGDEFYFENEKRGWYKVVILKKTAKTIKYEIIGRLKQFDYPHGAEYLLGKNAGYVDYETMPQTSKIEIDDDDVENFKYKMKGKVVGRVYANRDRKEMKWGKTKLTERRSAEMVRFGSLRGSGDYMKFRNSETVRLERDPEKTSPWYRVKRLEGRGNYMGYIHKDDFYTLPKGTPKGEWGYDASDLRRNPRMTESPLVFIQDKNDANLRHMYSDDLLTAIDERRKDKFN